MNSESAIEVVKTTLGGGNAIGRDLVNYYAAGKVADTRVKK